MVLSGCAVGYSSRVSEIHPPHRDRAVVFIALNKSAAENYEGIRATKTTSSLLSFDKARTETQPDVIKAIVEGAVAAALKTWKPIP
jgi:hypothetical protein